ncbi:MAG: type II secretion system protein [Verrucomicrobiales bacterium]|nr:type II secretion system protein [Verrucomicrobiales bacterium]
MKPLLHPKKSRGFTLVELLVAIGIVALLATMAVGYMQLANKRANIRSTEQRIKAIEMWLEAYKQDNGEYPDAADEKATTEVAGGTYTCGGAMAIYQAITADGNDQIKGYRARTDRGEQAGASRGEIGWTNGTIYAQDMNTDPEKKGWYKKIDEKWMFVDAFGHPFEYKKSEGPNDEEINNRESYDLWSYGTLKVPEESDEARQSWIKNW